MVTSSSGFLPGELVDAIKSEIVNISHVRSRGAATFSVVYRVVCGVPTEAHVMARERITIVPLTT